MTEEKFSELVNLYLDKEISEGDLAELKGALAANSERAENFRERVRLHQATRMAMRPQGSRSRRSSRSGRSSQRSSGSGHPSSRRRKSSSTTRFPRSLIAGGVAACLGVGLLFLITLSQDSAYMNSKANPSVVAGSSGEGELLDEIGFTELRRFAAAKAQSAPNQRASLASQLRLMGLRPELTPEQKRLRPVDLAALEASRFSRSGADLLDEVQKISPMPESPIFRAGSLMSQPATSQWPAGFQSSLASFR